MCIPRLGFRLGPFLCIAYTLAMPAFADAQTVLDPASGAFVAHSVAGPLGALSLQEWPSGSVVPPQTGAGSITKGPNGPPSDWITAAAKDIVPDDASDLIGSSGAGKAKVGGFLEGLGAFTYSSPAHWSRAVGRLQVVGQGEFANEVKWKIGGRVDVDPVYFSSNFYLDQVKHDQRLSAIWGENYLDFSAGDWNFRFGAQHIVWGEVVGLFFADVVSARDMRDFLLPSFDIIRIPQAAARAEYFKGDSHVEFVWIPVPTFDRIGKPGADFYPAPLPSPTSPDVAALFRNPDRPARTLSNANYGVRANTLASGWDVAGFYYRSFNTEPTFYPEQDPTQPGGAVFQPRYDRIWQAGGTLTKDFDDFVFRAEAVYTHGLGFNLADTTMLQSVVQRPTLAYILSVDLPLPKDSHINVQAFQNIYNGGGKDLAIRNDGVGASIFASTKLNSSFEPQILWIQNFSGGGGLVRPRLNWYAAKNTSIGFGVDVFTGPATGYFGRYNNRDRAYAEVRYDF